MSNYTATRLHIDTENIAVSMIIAAVGVFGLVSNGTAMLAMRCNPALRNSFGLLCFSHSIANIGVLLIFVCWVVPMTLLQDEIAAALIGKLCGMVTIMLWNVSVYSHLAISLNRVVAITMPLRASKMLALKYTAVVVFFCWTIGFCYILPYFWTDSCFVFFDTMTWRWTFADTPCGYIISIVTDLYTSLGAFIVISVLDSITLVCLKVRHKRMNSRNGIKICSDADQRKRHQTEVRFFKQTLYQNVLYFYVLLNFHLISPFLSNHWAVFYTSTFAWEMCHSLDGFVVVMFHFRFSDLANKMSRTNHKPGVTTVWSL